MDVVPDLSKGQSLALDKVLEQVVPLDVQVVDCLVHTLDARLG